MGDGEFRNVPIDANSSAWRRGAEVLTKTIRIVDDQKAQGRTPEQVAAVAGELIEATQGMMGALFAGQVERALDFLTQAERALVATERVLAGSSDERSLS